MLRRSLVLLAAALLLLAVVAEAARHSRSHLPSSRVTVYDRSSVPEGWVRLEQAKPEASVRFTLVVKGQNADKLERLFWERSDPDHDSFAHWLSNAEIEGIVAPTAEEQRVLYATLASHGVSALSVVSHGDSFDVTTTVAAASSLFQTTFYRFAHVKSRYVAVRQWGAYSVPASLAPQLELVLGVHTFPTLEQRLQMSAARRERVRRLESAAPRPAWVPKAVSSIYGVPFPIAPLSTPDVNAGVIEWVGQTFSADDLSNFSVNTATPLSPVNSHRIVGNNSEVPYPGIEAELDIQWIEGINPGFTPWFWLVSDPEQWLYSFTVQFLTATDYPSVISLSYGLPEFLQCSAFNPSDCNGVDYRQYIKIVDKQWMKIGLIGVSVITATQDRGVYVSDPGTRDIQRFTPEYPGSSAFVTSVGATEYANPVFDLPEPPPACNSTGWQCISGGSNEQSVSYAISQFVTSGGFSDVDTTPAYQAQAVAGYFSSGVKLPNATLYNASGRGSPDVGAIGYNGYTIDGGQPVLVSGASMSTPIFAAIIALVQNDFSAISNSTLGFLNPLLYKGQMSGAALFTDIIIGDNCASAKCQAQQDGFLASKGWDPVSGLGSPLYPAMKAYVQQLARRVVERRK